MESIIICEGETDLVLLQYYMIKTNGWKDSGTYSLNLKIKDSKSRDLIKNTDKLTIISCGGCGNIKTVFESVIRKNQNEISDEKRYSKIVIITDNDDKGTEERVISELNQVSRDINKISNNTWTELEFEDSTQTKFTSDLLLLIIPFNENGALETFLLNAVAKQDAYDAEIIKKGNEFVENVDPDSKYLKHRWLITKAKFDVYFSVRTAAKQFGQRQNILKNVPWEQYEEIRTCFKELEKL